MRKHSNLLYYSVGTKVSYYVNTEFYDKHFLWCAPVFDPSSLASLDSFKKISTTSSPHDIYHEYLRAIKDGGDRHSDAIKRNREGIKTGALFKLQEGVIDKEEYAMIVQMADTTSIAEFRPVLYIIPSSIVGDRMERVSVDKTANPLGIEYIIKDLVAGEFEVIEFIK